jgi:hypothetical protein
MSRNGEESLSSSLRRLLTDSRQTKGLLSYPGYVVGKAVTGYAPHSSHTMGQSSSTR